MTSISWSNGPIFRGNAVGTGQACCCNACDVDVTQAVGGETSGSIVFTYAFPSSPQCVRIVFTMPDCTADVSVASFFPYQTLYSGSAGDGLEICVLKPDGAEYVDVNIGNILPSNCSFSFRITCGGCDCNQFP